MVKLIFEIVAFVVLISQVIKQTFITWAYSSENLKFFVKVIMAAPAAEANPSPCSNLLSLLLGGGGLGTGLAGLGI